MNYKTKQNTPAYNSLAAYRYGGKKKGVKKYPGGGMYADNTVSAGGQGGEGSTSNIVYKESNPDILKAKVEAMEAAKLKLQNESEMTQQDVKEMEGQTEAIAAEAAASAGQNVETGLSVAKTGLDMYKGMQPEKTAAENEAKRKAAEDAAGVSNLGKVVPGLTVAEAGAQNAQTIGKHGADAFTKTMADTSADLVTDQLVNKGTELAVDQSQNLAGSYGNFGSTALPTGVTPPVSTLPPPITTATTGTLAPAVGVTGAGTNAAATGLGWGGKGLMSTTGVGASGIGSGIGKFATSGAGIGTIAALAGTGISMLSDDKDATKLNFGEGTGAVLSGVGTGMGAAALAGAAMGTAVPVLGNVIGAVAGAAYGLGKALIGRKKARKAKKKHENEVKAKKDKYNKKLMGDLGTQAAIVRAGELEQKTYSGYDLGRNLTARRGGYRGMQNRMKYA